MKRIVAYRPLFYLALSFILGIFCAYLMFFNRIVLSLITLVIIFSVILALVIKKEFRNKIIAIFINVCKSKRVFCILCVVFILLGFLLTGVRLYGFKANMTNISNYDDSVVCGTVVEISKQKGGYGKFILDNIYLVEENGHKKNLAGKALVTTFNTSIMDVLYTGIKIKYEADLNINDMSDKHTSNNLYKMQKEIYYVSVVSQITILNKDKNKTIAENVRNYIREILVDTMPYENAMLSFSVLFGDDSTLKSDDIEAYKASGVMHIIAVSGMNIALIIAIFLLLFRFIKIGKWWQYGVIIVALLFYCYLCDFGASVTRATIMGIVILSANFFGRPGDILSSLGLSAIIILTINPLDLFDAGFALSFSCMLGIIFLCQPINKFLNKKCKMPGLISETLAMTLSAQIGIYPIMAYLFHSFAVYSIFANLVVVPLFSLAYIVLFGLLLVVVIFKFLSPLLLFPAGIMNIISIIPHYFVDLPFALCWVPSMGVFAIVFYFLVFILSKFFLANKKGKAIMASFCVLLVVVGSLISLMPNHDKSSKLLYVNDSYVIKAIDKFVLTDVPTDMQYIDYLQCEMFSKKIFSLDAVIVWERFNTEDMERIVKLKSKIKVKEFYFAKGLFDENKIKKKIGNNYKIFAMDEKIVTPSMQFKIFGVDNNIISLHVEFGGTNAVILKSKVNYIEMNLAYENGNTFGKVDDLVVKKIKGEINFELFDTNIIIEGEKS